MTDDLQLLRMARLGCQLQLNQLDERIAELSRKPSASQPFRVPGKRKMSAEARKKIAEAQRKRWEAHRAGEKTPAAEQAKPTKRPKAKMSAAGKKRIKDANQKRWAEFRAKKEAGAKAAKTATASS